MENRLSTQIMKKVTYTTDCVEITNIVDENMRALCSVETLLESGVGIDGAALAMVRAMASVNPIDLLRTRRMN